MELTIGKHKLGMDGPSYQVSRVATHRKTGEQYQTDYLYYSSLDGAARSLLERMVGDGLREDRPEVVDVKSLIAVLDESRAAVMAALNTMMDRDF